MIKACRTLVILLAFAAFAAACKKGGSPSVSPVGPSGGDSTPVTVDTVHSAKKGACFSTNTTDGYWSSDITELKAQWYYTWGTPLPSFPPTGLEFVPMFWGAANVDSLNLATVAQLAASGQAKYVLGFNEPDQSGQSNMTVDQVLALWPQLESLNLPLGSPATSWPTIQWFTDFMDSVASRNLRVDFICVHMYVGLDDTSFVQVLQQVYNQYHLPIWITEFATADWNAATPANNPYTPQQVQAFMQRLLPQLDSLPFVKRYSWFSGDPSSGPLWSSALVDVQGNLTSLGTWYAGH